jgi:hypothetical protein
VLTTLWFLPVRLDFAPVELKQQIDGITATWFINWNFPDDLVREGAYSFCSRCQAPGRRAAMRRAKKNSMINVGRGPYSCGRNGPPAAAETSLNTRLGNGEMRAVLFCRQRGLGWLDTAAAAE